jgi:TIR domain
MSGDSLEKGDAAQSSVPLSRDVFISYASQDAAVANAVVEALERQGIRCWIAPRDVVPGEFYADAIVHAIDAVQALVLVLSQNAAVSHHILREIENSSGRIMFSYTTPRVTTDRLECVNESHSVPTLLGLCRRRIAPPGRPGKAPRGSLSI